MTEMILVTMILIWFFLSVVYLMTTGIGAMVVTDYDRTIRLVKMFIVGAVISLFGLIVMGIIWVWL